METWASLKHSHPKRFFTYGVRGRLGVLKEMLNLMSDGKSRLTAVFP